MKTWTIVLALLLPSVVIAQPMQEVVTIDKVEIRAEQTRTFSIDAPIGRFSLSKEGVAEVLPETDRTFTIKGLAPGEVMMTAYGTDGRVLHRANIFVGQTSGLVRIFGQSKGGKQVDDFIGYYCSSGGCGRADPDKIPTPFSTTISETKDKGNANSVTTSREYR
ncbi:pilus assembly protein N-terminal domain-containing protein [Bradyrhizobium elkanii]|uniref:pilus assembly protein N-terminal domain-containing protein n=1 Tax=Bradyrhizobium elkanii TaxID=29448 RepID=UPI00272D45BB|nr:pilus assembly protein N-terminal domain-containing protein [Bradyrhizobium elkanii]WLA80271.1 pilus assembly protein N-terminal domain-containing protein [Bradyrhizobium elkanii]